MVWVDDIQDPFYLEEDVEVELNKRREHVTPMTLEETMRSFNEKLIKDQEEKNQINAAIL
jgi:hypothetical protein